MKAEEQYFLTLQNHKKFMSAMFFFFYVFTTVLFLTENTGIGIKGRGQPSSTSEVRTILSTWKVGWSER